LLEIRDEQIRAIETLRFDAFTTTMVRHLRKNFAREVNAMEEAELRAFIVDGVEKAERYEILIQADVARFIGYMAYWGPGFDHDSRLAWVTFILRDESLDGTAKMDAIDAHGAT
jgi:hypothetical protein